VQLGHEPESFKVIPSNVILFRLSSAANVLDPFIFFFFFVQLLTWHRNNKIASITRNLGRRFCSAFLFERTRPFYPTFRVEKILDPEIGQF
jgi:hypothetical protein